MSKKRFFIYGKRIEHVESRSIEAETLQEAVSKYIGMWEKGQLVVLEGELQVVSASGEGV